VHVTEKKLHLSEWRGTQEAKIPSIFECSAKDNSIAPQAVLYEIQADESQEFPEDLTETKKWRCTLSPVALENYNGFLKV
jgi:hypothetical protein